MRTLWKNNFFKTIIILMTLSIIGLVIVQIYWLNRAYAAGESEFDGKMNRVLDETAQLLNQKELDSYYAYFDDARKTLRDSTSKPQVVVSQMERDSGNVRYVYLTRFVMDQIPVPISGKYNDSLNVTELYSSERSIKFHKNDSSRTFQPLDINLDAEFKDATYSLERWARFDAGNKPISKRIDLKIADSILTVKMKARGIETAFETGILARDSVSIELQSPQFKLTKKNYRTPLFFGRDDNPSYFLSVYLPEKRQTIYKSISALFGITLLFTLTILGIYIASVVNMVRQRQISQLKTDFMNNMTHEFKTPIATISVATDALKSPVVSKDPEKVKHYAALIKQENKRMNNQVEMVLRMSKLERNEIRLDKVPIHMNDLVRESVDSIRLIVENRNGTIFENYNAIKDEIAVDPFHMGNIILNVLDNANKYSPENPQIKVETYNDDEHFVVAVSDQGIGMNKSVLPRIFDKFFREETGNIHNVKGHGLGLAYVKHIIGLHGGDVTVESDLGKGSMFFLKIPIQKTMNNG